MRRRDFITLFGGAAVAWPMGARAQRSAIPVVGFATTSGAIPTIRPDVFRQVLSENGYVEGRNVAFDIPPTGLVYFERLPSLVAELVRRRVTVIFASGPPAVRAAKAATTSIPIVFSVGEDPVKEGLVASLNHPGGNVTGYASLTNQLVPKRLELLRELLPRATALGLLVNPTNPNAVPDATDAQAAAAVLGLRLQVLTAATEGELETAFATAVQQHLGALLVGVDPQFRTTHRERITSLAARHAIPAIYERRSFIDVGGLMSYSTDEVEASRQEGIYIARILKGAKPADLPVQQATKFEFVLNLKATKALGLDVPTSIRLRADKLIE